jgi:hypothetical protein
VTPSSKLIARDKATAAAVVTVVLLVVGYLVWLLDSPMREMYQAAYSCVGKPQEALRQLLGPPEHIVTAASLKGRTVDYPWKGWNFVPVPSRPVRDRVLLYRRSNAAVYVYVDERGIIEYVATAGT